MYTVKIVGFNTKEQAEEFAHWYSEQGEQDACIWFECREELGCSSMLTDVKNQGLIVIKMVKFF